MEKLDYKTRIEDMKSLIKSQKFAEALEMADSINWRKVININELLVGSKAYEACGKLEEARDLLLLAHERSPIGRVVLNRLCKVSIKLGDLEAAQQYYNEFVQIAPHDSQKYILKYNLAVAKKCDNTVLIKILEQLKEQDFIEEWAYELAYLYHQTNMSEKCIELCNEIILWFGDGPVVERALELKMLYQPLDKAQGDKYRHLQQEKEGITEIEANEPLQSGEIVPHTITIPSIELPPDRFNTVNLQAEIKKNIEEIMKATEAGEVSENMEAIKSLVEEIPYLQVIEDEPQTEIEDEESVNDMFKAFLAEEYDGQLSLLLPDDSSVSEEQVRGQMTIDDVIAEWERTKRAAEQAMEEARLKELQIAKARALREAQSVLTRLEEAMPLLDAGVTSVELLREEYLSNPETKGTGEATFSIPRVDSTGEKVGSMEIPVLERGAEALKTLQNAASLLEASDMLADVNEMLQQEIDRLTEPAGLPEEIQEEKPELSTSQDMLAESLEEKIFAEAFLEEPQPVEEPQTDMAYVQQELPEVYEQPVEVQQIQIKDEMELPSIAAPEELFEKEEVFNQNAIEAALEIELKAALAEENRAEEPIPVIQEAVLEPEEIAQLVDENVLARGLEKEDSGIDLDNEDLKVFSYFLPLAGMKSSIRQVVSGASAHLDDASNTGGNILIVGERGCGKTQMATSIIKVLQKKTGRPKGGIGKISGDKLNEKDIQTLYEKIQGGCLIIEEAGQISRDAAVTLSLLMEQDKKGTIIIMEDSRKGIERALLKDPSFAKRFTEKIVIPVFSIDELVEFGRTYGEEEGYIIDDMGVLALYNRINLVGRFDYATTIKDVTEIMDEAFKRSAKGGIFARQKKDKEGRIILREKDFD